MQYYSQCDGLQSSENHQELFKSLENWKKKNVSNYWKPQTSLTISIGDIGPGHIDSFIADPFRVSQILSTRNVSISASGMAIAPVGSPAKEIENISGYRETPLLASIVFPHLGPDIRVTPFSYCELNFDNLLKEVQKEYSDITNIAFDQTVIKKVMGEDFDTNDLKCAIFMSNMLEAKQTSLFIQALARVTKQKLAIGGCIGNMAHFSHDQNHTFQDLDDILKSFDSYTDDIPTKYAHTVGLIFAGPKCRAASVLLTTKINTKSKVKNELMKLKALNVDESKSAAFMFACCGRGRHFYKGKANVESETFQSLFPNTPLIGIFGNGEIGLTYCPEATENADQDLAEPDSKRFKSQERRRLNRSEFSHSFTTVFVLLSFD